jgi:CRP-like cAMP-binding protein
MSLSHDPRHNGLLAALAEPDFARLAPQLRHVVMPLGQLLYAPDAPLHAAYFPTSMVVSLHHVLASGASAETAAVGNEGVVGIPLFMGGGTTSSFAAVQIAGEGYSLATALLQQEFDRGGAMQRLLLKYMQALIVQTTQTAVCNRHHSVEQQICRWLLSTLDRAPSREIMVTQEMIAGALGVRRESVTEAAAALQRSGVIRYRRGHISVLERTALERSVCECYAVVRREMSRLLGWGPGSQSPRIRELADPVVTNGTGDT